MIRKNAAALWNDCSSGPSSAGDNALHASYPSHPVEYDADTDVQDVQLRDQNFR